ncbi:hypothetical protein K469DRAFT_672760 [Zopfia rhizophila CBS 207.26]|uniref:Uncharacterized protein n=1 Tax=Zopfia rhizophila CBS 207.26 TaxID=1314779 RepID=A0A6A6DMV8_9PEZI|nr:hypothetical protein K469DRAFT_672760 [Zopfia rhizophila CBS 207.26]
MPLVRPPPTSNTSSITSSQPTKQIPPFANCKRTQFEAGKNDWFQITAPHHYTNFDVCPDCFNSSIKPTAYARFFSPQPPKPEGVRTRCDFSDLWVRIAWAWLYSQGVPDLTLLGSITEMQDPEGSCPNLDSENEEVKKKQKPSATRTWYCLRDPRTGELVEDLTVCSHCILQIDTITPCLRGIFVPAAGGQKVAATCDLMVPYSERTIKYLDQFIDVAEKTLKTGYRIVTPLTDYVKKWAPIPTCPKSTRIQGRKCWSMSSAVPEFTVCEECYIEHIQPALSKPSPALVFSQLSIQPQIPPSGFHCQLSSPRLQQYWADACSTSDLALLRQKIMQRNTKSNEFTQKLEGMRMQYEQQKIQAKFHYDMMLMEQSSALNASLAWQIGGGWGGPTDFRATNAHMSQGAQMEMQANMTLANMQMVEKEWKDFWE